MVPRSIFPYSREGVWKTDYTLYIDEAVSLLDEYNKYLDHLNKLKQSVPKDEHEKDAYYFETVDPQQAVVYMSYVKLTLMCCMSIEAFLNYYGVKRLGGKYYDDNIERLNPIRKINILIAICFQEVNREHPEAINEIKNLFNVRNAFVHPTTKEYKISDISEKPQLFAPRIFTYETGAKMINSLRMFLEWFKEHDPEIDLNYELTNLQI